MTFLATRSDIAQQPLHTCVARHRAHAGRISPQRLFCLHVVKLSAPEAAVAKVDRHDVRSLCREGRQHMEGDMVGR